MTDKTKQKLTLAGQFPGKFIEGIHLDEHKPTELTIKEVKGAGTVLAMDPQSGQEKPVGKPVIYFEETPKGWILNKTNARTVALDHGQNMEKWVGVKVKLYQARVNAFGKPNTPVIRVMR